MSGLFALLHFAALVCFIVFLVKMIKRKKSGEDYSQPKKIRGIISMCEHVAASGNIFIPYSA